MEKKVIFPTIMKVFIFIIVQQFTTVGVFSMGYLGLNNLIVKGIVTVCPWYLVKVSVSAHDQTGGQMTNS